MLINTWTVILQEAFQDVFRTFVNFVPNVIGAILFLAIGWLVGVILARIVSQIFHTVRLDSALRYAGVETILTKAGMTLNSAGFMGALVKWLIIIVFLMFSLNVIGLEQAAYFIKDAIGIILPQVLLAAAILIITAVVARFVNSIVTGSARAADVESASFIGSLAKWAIWVMGALTAFAQLGVDASFIYTLFTGVVVAFSLAFGLAFGLGGQDVAGRYLAKLQKEMEK
jgi:small-conductance mechanosensitive channel